MSKCQVCEGRAQLFLCLTHITALRDALRELPWWLIRLNETAVGDVRLGEGGRRGTRAHELDEFTGSDGADKLERARRDGRFDLDKVLAHGRVNAKASRLMDQAGKDLDAWVRHSCEAWGHVPASKLGAIGCAVWLAKHTHAIASDEAAGECYNFVIDLTDQIRRIVNRPEPPQFCGPCIAELNAEQRAKLVREGREDRTHCRVQLYAKRTAQIVKCPECGTEHNVEELQAAMLAEADEYSFSISDLVDFVLPKLDIAVKRRTLQHWAKIGDLIPSGWESNVARYQLAHVREVVGAKRTRGRR